MSRFSLLNAAFIFAGALWRGIKRLERLLGIRKTTYVNERVPFYKEMWSRAASEEGYEFIPLSRSIWEVRNDSRRIAVLDNYIISLDDPVVLNIAGDKLLTYQLFERAGLSVPAHAFATAANIGSLRSFMRETAGPYVVKPARNTASGLGVTTNISSWPQCLWAAALAGLYCDEILIEQHIAGESYRLLFLDGEMLCASRRAGVRVVGDGKRSIGELLIADDSTRTSGVNWKRDMDTIGTLRAQGMTLGDIPELGATVLVRSANCDANGRTELRTVYTEDVTHILDQDLIDAGRKASRALGSEFCGVDIITLNPSVPLAESGGVVSEINTTPGLHHHYGISGSGLGEPLANRVLRYAESKGRD